MSAAAPIVLLTDFGDSDWFVGSMKGVLLGISPESRVVDLCHQVAPGDIAAGSFILEAAFDSFPPGTVFCCVIDPGVGTERAVLVALANSQIVVAPDNGLLSGILDQHPEAGLYRASNASYFREMISDTFHGRDIFAPLAAHLARGIKASDCGTPFHQEPSRLPGPPPSFSDGHARGRVVYVDRFGNLITNLQLAALDHAFPGRATSHWKLRVKNVTLIGLSKSYGHARHGELLFYRGSTDRIEIAENMGNAALTLAVNTGDSVDLFV